MDPVFYPFVRLTPSDPCPLGSLFPSVQWPAASALLGFSPVSSGPPDGATKSRNRLHIFGQEAQIQLSFVAVQVDDFVADFVDEFVADFVDEFVADFVVEFAADFVVDFVTDVGAAGEHFQSQKRTQGIPSS